VILLGGSISGIGEVIGAFLWGETIEEVADSALGGFDCAGVGFAQQGLQLGKDLFDRIEVGRVAGQEDQLGAGGADQAPHGLAPVAAAIIHDDNIARTQGGDQKLLDPRFPRGQAPAPKLVPLIGPSMTQGAAMRSWRSAATNVSVRRRPCGTLATRRAPRLQRPCGRVMLVLAQRCYGASGEDKASSSLETTDGVPHAAAE
jgi:hypothetical protein